MIGTLIWLALCSWLNRWRGSGAAPFNPHGWGHSLQRAVYSLVLASPAMVASLWHGIAIFFLLFIFGFSMGWGSYIDFGTGRHGNDVEWIDRMWDKFPGNDATKDYIAVSLRGLMFTVPPALVGALMNPLALLIAPFGALMAPVYLIGHRMFQKYRIDPFIPNELAWGAILGALFMDLGLLMHFN